ncbi:MAG: hypothetical protein U0174_13375 [Polyangiaceae bacterium]
MDVTCTLSPAWAHMRRILFRPVNAGAWFSFGFMFFLQSCSEGGGGSGGNFNNLGKLFNNGGSRRYGSGYGTNSSLAHAFDLAPDGAFGHDASLVIGIIIAVCVLAIPLVLLAMWLGARGQMMSIRAVATGSPAVSDHWHQTKEPASSLFKFHLVMGAVALALFGPLVAIAAYVIVNERDSNGYDPFAHLGLILGFGAIALVLLIPFTIVGSLARNFVAPIMLKKGILFREAWREFMTLARGNWGKIIVFWFIRFGFSIAAAMLSMLVTVFTCCLGALPVVNQTLMAPFHVFERSYTLYILRSIGAEYNLIEMPDEDAGYGGGGYGGGGGYPGYGPQAHGPHGGPMPPAGGFGSPYPPYS